jgi:hypothetical protein
MTTVSEIMTVSVESSVWAKWVWITIHLYQWDSVLTLDQLNMRTGSYGPLVTEKRFFGAG